MKIVIVAAVALLALAMAFGQRDRLTGWLKPEPPPKPIVFDNGTVRDVAGAASAAAAPVAQSLPMGTMRKCVRGSETQYTNVPCPAGFKELTVSGDRVTVVSSSDAKPKAAPGAEPAGERRKNVRDLVDADGGQMREKMIDRATR